MRLHARVVIAAMIVMAARIGYATVAGPLGCCDIEAFNPLTGLPSRYCTNTDQAACVLPESLVSYVQNTTFISDRLCIDRVCVSPPAEHITTANGLTRSDNCRFDDSSPIISATAREELLQCFAICNDTDVVLNRFTLLINGQVEFANVAGTLGVGSCTTASRVISATATTVYNAHWCASPDTIGSCPPGTNDQIGGASGFPSEVFTDTQVSVLLIDAQAAAPTLGTIGLCLLGAGLTGLGIHRLTRRA